ncbi:MAG: hypothetical protein HUU55_17490 [Myxococcales bacterium]|nr:hypothetical protein [Myxococcales bacterium]
MKPWSFLRLSPVVLSHLVSFTLFGLVCFGITACDGNTEPVETATDGQPNDTSADMSAQSDTAMDADHLSSDSGEVTDSGSGIPDVSSLCELGDVDETFRMTSVSWVSPTDSGNVFAEFVNDKFTVELNAGFVWVIRIKENADGSAQIEVGKGQQQGSVLLFDGPPTKLAANIFQCVAKGGPEVGTQALVVTSDLTLPVRALVVDAEVKPALTEVTGQIRGHILRRDAETLIVKLPTGSPKPMDELLVQLGATPSVDTDGDEVFDAWALAVDFVASRP